MPGPAGDDRIPGAVPPLPLPDFEYDDLEKGERIGTGGDADVYRATINHNGYTYPVAVKEPRFEGTIQRRVVEKFETEAETWSGLNDHDNIVSVYGWGAEPLPWLGLEFMDGGTLDARIGSLDVAEALWLSGRIAEGIRYGHRHGIAHLDIKPTNVLLRDTPDGKWKYPKVSDWGLAKMLLEHSNSIEGISPTYAAPEQFDAKEYGSPDDITDIYQLGALVYALVAGEPPFSGSSTAVMQGVLQEEPDPPSAVNSAVPTAVDDVVLKTLAKEKGDRYEGVLPFRKELDRLFAEYIGGDVDTTTSGVAPPADEPTDQTSERSTDTGNDTTKADKSKTADAEPQTQSSSGSRDDGGSSSHSSTRQKTDDDDSSLVSRRTALGLIGVGVFGGGGWMAAQMGGNNDDSAGSTVPTETETESPPESPTETSPADVLFQDQFKTSDTGYDPDKWTTKRASRGTLTQTERNSLLVSPPSDSYAGIRTNSDFSPPITLNFEIDEWTQAYASGIYVGFLDQEYPSAEDRASPQNRSRNSIIAKFQRENKGLQFITQRDSPIGSGEDTKENQSWNVKTKSEIGWESGEISTVKIDWSGSEAVLSIDGEMIFRETENIPDGALSLYIMAHSWVPPGDSELLLRNLRITK